MRATVLLVTVLALTPATVLAQQEKQSTYDLTVTTEQKLYSEKLLRIRLNQQIQKFNTVVKQALRETQEIKQFSTPYLAEFQRRNEDIQRRRDFINITSYKLFFTQLLKALIA
jgi:ribosomal protein L3